MPGHPGSSGPRRRDHGLLMYVLILRKTYMILFLPSTR
jgi:hypothetical protein